MLKIDRLVKWITLNTLFSVVTLYTDSVTVVQCSVCEAKTL